MVVGSKTGRVALKKGDTAGYDCGEVWLVPSPDSYRDPIRRALALAKIGQKLLEYSAEPVEYIRSASWDGWPENSAADPFTGEEVVVLGPHEDENVTTSQGLEWQGCGYRDLHRVTGGDAVVVRKVASFDTTTYRRRRVDRVVVRPTADRNAVSEWLLRKFAPKSE